jgi:hypothetical protein
MMNAISRVCVVLAGVTLSVAYSLSAAADDDVAAFATASYATGLRTKEMKNLMDTDGDGMVSRAEWDAYQEKVFTRLDSHKRGRLNVAIFASRTAVRLSSDFATGGYAQGLSSAELARKIDANGDGWISHEEWMTYQGKVFDLMNTSVTHKGQLGDKELFATGGTNQR